MNLVRLVVCLTVGVQACLATQENIVGPTLSCFKGFQNIETEGCSLRVEDDDGGYSQTAISSIRNMDFCVSGPGYGPSQRGNFGKSKTYVAMADLKMTDLGKYSSSYGFMGLAFNMIDSKNYDIAYVRPHAKDYCWEVGYVEKGHLFGRDFGPCQTATRGEVSVAIKVTQGQAEFFVNDALVTTFNPFFPAVNKVSSAMRNNMVAEMSVKNLEVCHEMSCVYRDSDGNKVVARPGDHYKEANARECEACVCGLYGQVKCGCLSADEQNVSCTGGLIPANGEDCCARCVPAAGYCSASGDPHYRSLDGRSFDYMGKCTYCLLGTSDFEVRQKNYPAGSASVTEYCQILFDGDMLEMHGNVLNYTPKDGTERSIATPFKKYYKPDDYIVCNTGRNCKIYIGNTQMLDLSCGRGSFSLTVHGTYYQKTKCLCGVWDGIPGNDFQDQNGNIVSANTMGNSWRRGNDDGCPNPPDPVDPCEELSRDERNWAEQFCARYKQEPFRSCPLDVTQYFKSCIFDVCTDPTQTDTVCENAAAYAEACARAGHPITGWRSRSFCPMECEETFIFDDCGKGCYPTCDNPTPDDCSETCVEGCYCPRGTVLQDGRCIDSGDCQCMHEGEIIDNGASWNDTVRCESCTCLDGGLVECDPIACNQCPEGEAPVSSPDSCCPICVANWAWEEQSRFEVTEGEGPVRMQCNIYHTVLTSPDDITWKDGNGQVLSSENVPDNFHFDEENLILTIRRPVQLADEGSYTAEVNYEGVVGTCNFHLTVNQFTVNIIDIDGENPREVKEGDCQTMSVEVVNSDYDLSFADFVWTKGDGVTDTPIDFDNPRFTKKNGGKTIEICDAEEGDEDVYGCCVSKDGVTDCVQIELRVLVVCDTENEEQYTEGDDWMEGEHKSCTCTAQGEIECTCVEQDVECQEGEEFYWDDDCTKLCSREPGTCEITGDPHYKSFDGYRHDFQGGNCRFTLIRTSDFEVIGTNKHRDGNTNVAWNDAVEVKFKRKTLDIFMGPEGEVMVNDAVANLPYEKTWRSKESVSVVRAGSTVVMTIELGNDLEALTVTWDGNSTVSATVHGKYFEQTRGLCGTWDDNNDNDLANQDLNDFGWSWKYTETDEVCEEEPQPPHPCDETFFPDAAPVADQACDILREAPFSACHEVVDVEAAIHNCKYDVCSCYDASCGCHAVKQYVKQCQEAGVTDLGSWRDSVDYCPWPCEAGLTYDACGSMCPPTCANKEPDCGSLSGQCNEGCFCPRDTYLQQGRCIPAEECLCETNGTFKEVGETWFNKDTCKECQCQAQGELVCEPVRCDSCKKSEMAYYQNEDDCCKTCEADWLWTTQAEHTDVRQHTDLRLECESVIRPFKVDWYYSGDGGENWELLETPGKANLFYNIPDITDENDGLYKCEARKNYKKKAVVISVATAEPANSCTGVAPDNGSVNPDQVEIGDVVSYTCDEGFYLDGEPVGTCGQNGLIDNLPTCAEVQQIEFVTSPVTARKGKANLSCQTEDDSFLAGSEVAFYFLHEDGTLEAIEGDVTLNRRRGKSVFTMSSVVVRDKPTTVVCKGTNSDRSKRGRAEIPIVQKG